MNMIGSRQNDRRQKREQRRRQENADAIAQYNCRVAERDVLSTEGGLRTRQEKYWKEKNREAIESINAL
jgi:hypothetical protein